MALVITSTGIAVTVAPDSEEPDIHIGGKVLIESLVGGRVQIHIESALRKTYEASLWNITVNGQVPSSIADLGTKLAAVFPDAGDVTGETNVIDVFLIAGQSNAAGQGDSAQSLTILPGTAFQYYQNALTEIEGDPVGNADTGSAWPAFAVRYHSMTGRKICFVPAAVGASAMSPGGSEDAAHRWDVTGTAYSSSVTKLTAALSALEAAGYTPFLKGILWAQGESDAININSSLTTGAAYVSNATTMIANYRTEFDDPYLPFFIVRTGTHTGQSDVGYAAVRKAQEDLAATLREVYIGFYETINFPARSLMEDGLHYNQTGYNEIGLYLAESVVNRYKYKAVFDTGLKPYDYTTYPLVYTATTAPSGTLTMNYRIRKEGNRVTISVWGVHTVAGSAVTVLEIVLPPDAPVPVIPPGFTAADSRLSSGLGGLMASPQGTFAGNPIIQLAKNATDTGYILYLKCTSANIRAFVFEILYYTAS